MSTGFHSYRGLELYPLVFPHQAARPGFAHNYDEGFDAAVRIQEMEDAGAAARSRVFRLTVKRPFENAGDARRASIAYAEQLIDACDPDKTVWDSE
jgi:hypothetical protein